MARAEFELRAGRILEKQRGVRIKICGELDCNGSARAQSRFPRAHGILAFHPKGDAGGGRLHLRILDESDEMRGFRSAECFEEFNDIVRIARPHVRPFAIRADARICFAR